MNIVLSILLYTWAGLILGVSFIATPAKFKAAHLTLPVALEVGKATFNIFNKIEWIVSLSIISLSAITPKPQFYWLLIFTLVFLLLLETFWLLPILDIRTEQIIAGWLIKPGFHHWLYICADASKIILALITGWYVMKETMQ